MHVSLLSRLYASQFNYIFKKFKHFVTKPNKFPTNFFIQVDKYFVTQSNFTHYTTIQVKYLCKFHYVFDSTSVNQLKFKNFVTKPNKLISDKFFIQVDNCFVTQHNFKHILTIQVKFFMHVSLLSRRLVSH